MAGMGLLASPYLPARTDPPAKGIPLMPPYLSRGHTIGITCPSSPLSEKEARYAMESLKSWGFEVVLGNSVDKQWQRYGGTDEERAADLQQMLDNPTIKAILFARGGYGAMRIIDKLNWTKFEQGPKWLIGFSDITAFHCHVHTRFDIPTMHADMVNGFNGIENASNRSLYKALSGQRTEYSFDGYTLNRAGQSSGQLVGGNLSLIYAMQASPSELKTDGKILFIEDVSEYKYTVDRMLMNLKRSGKLQNLAGLIVGGFTATKEDTEMNYPMSIEEIIMEKVQEYKYPVCFHFPAGHQKLNLALKLGLHYNLYVTNAACSLSEVADPHPDIVPAMRYSDSTYNEPSVPLPDSSLAKRQ